MKNLTVHWQDVVETKDDFKSYEEIDPAKCVCCENTENGQFYVFMENQLRVIIKKNQNEVITFPEEIGKIVAAEFCSISQQIFCARDSGILTVFDVENNFEHENKIFLEAGIKCMKLSPDQEIFAVVTQDDKVVVMSWDFSHTLSNNEENLSSSNFGEKQFITVGWGKKETQFHGSEGKAAAKAGQTILQKSENDNGVPRISWISDGTLFAVSFLDKTSEIRRFKVFNREGILQYTSESVNGLGESLAWKPSGNLIAIPQKLPNKNVIALFEKNGLKHREFTLFCPDKEAQIKDISWSLDSEVFSILYETKNHQYFIQLWTEKNYHWYLKQTLKFEEAVLHWSWTSSPKCGKILKVSTNENLITYNFRWCVNQSRGKNSNDKSFVAVIDGTKILVTSFRDCVVPPPMAQHVFDVGEEINFVEFAAGHSKNPNSFFCVLHDNSIVFFKYDVENSKFNHGEKLTMEWVNPEKHQKIQPNTIGHFCWFRENVILFSMHLKNSIARREWLYKLFISEDGLRIDNSDADWSNSIQHILPSSDPLKAYIISKNLEDSNCHYLKITDCKDEIHSLNFILDDLCCQCEFVKIEGINDFEDEKEDVLLSRSNRHRFYINDKEVANNITSFHVHSEFLLLTTLQHTLLSFPLSKAGLELLKNSNLTVKPWENGVKEESMNGFSIRRVERGSTLVTVVPKSTRCVLQMPRGNLECIQPRALCLFVISNLISNLEYAKAFDLMRKQRINLNLFFDHDPQSFLQNAKKFVEDVKNPHHLSLFLAELTESDVTRDIYSSSYNHHNGTENYQRKIEKICDIVGHFMENHPHRDKLVQPILTALVKKKKNTGLENALGKIRELRENEENSASAEEALRFLLYLVNVNHLVDVALGMYDFDMAMFVAQKSQKDPKEYVPFFENFRKMEKNYMMFSIDKHLGRWEKALEHIARIPKKFEECLEFLETKGLHSKALKIFPTGSEEYKEVASSYGKFLAGKMKYEEAGVMFAKGEKFGEALKAFKVAGCWQEAIIMAKMEGLSPSDFHRLYQNLASRLESDKRYKEAAFIFSKYLNDPEESIVTLCKGKLWLDVWREIHCIGRDDLIEIHVKPGVHEHMRNLLIQITKNKDDFDDHEFRLNFIRSDSYMQEMQAKNQILEYDFSTEKGRIDMMSDTSSISGSTGSRNSQNSKSSGRSCRSSKSRKKQERKLLSVRQGSFFEDLAIIKALHQIVSVTYAQKGEVHAVAQMLLFFNEDVSAEKLCMTLKSFLEVIEKTKCTIWRKNVDLAGDDNQKEAKQQFLCGDFPEGLVEPHVLKAPEKPQDKSFEEFCNIFEGKWN